MSKVLLYVYDLSNGMARALSLPLTGKQIDGIWHTSVVVFNREVFYGQGVMETRPGMSHHGQPMQVVDCGTTEIPEEVFDEYLSDLKEEYTATKYHLLNFNCNSFTQDVIGFLTGGRIPEWISSLPAEFLSTPFGQQLKPRIDAMYGGQPVGGPPADLSGGLLGGIASQAAGPSYPTRANGQQQPIKMADSVQSSLFMVTNPASFDSALEAHPDSIAMFVSKRTRGNSQTKSAVEESFEELARNEDNGSKIRMDYLVVDVDVGKGKEVADRYNVDVTEAPVFIIFKQGKKIDVLTNTDPDSLEAAVIWHIAQIQDGV